MQFEVSEQDNEKIRKVLTALDIPHARVDKPLTLLDEAIIKIGSLKERLEHEKNTKKDLLGFLWETKIDVLDKNKKTAKDAGFDELADAWGDIGESFTKVLADFPPDQMYN
jgi:hypothetical protein